ncbi:MAG: dehydrogenase [Candidatus Thermofonsia Clade 1 bacterium]|jgi:predicted dehydrogenase|uniref:Dehydrogenase n=1 Tax=Candidatus Thermofonsia Clade 1 bacterium TaxID=2364210 RepID=A0A2M8PEV3_9CHLR|nr:MAG: dehydrogenase [Candidatus Thermofonsia Clade 1 bacterium]RMF53515.1 MAG: gfo/Idh/MocA family oxidoreductase [Chloroflexota bacterium]
MIRWGILSTGRIARAFATALKSLPDAKLLAVGSRHRITADEFAINHDVPRAYDSYEALAADPDVDVIYIGTPHPMHAENTLMCLEAGKHVLCEKPFAMNAAQAQAMIDRARQKRLFLMEAMWTRFIPAVAQAKRLIDQGALGKVWMMSGAFCFRAPYSPKGRLFAPELGGGSLLDVGVYVLSFASWLFGKPKHIHSQARIGFTGVDEHAVMQLVYEDGELAALTSAITLKMPIEVILAGTEGYLTLHEPFYKAQRFTITPVEGEPQTYTVPYEGNGYQFQAMEVMRCLRAGLLESPTMPLEETLQIMQTMDAIRAQWGLTYPNE